MVKERRKYHLSAGQMKVSTGSGQSQEVTENVSSQRSETLHLKRKIIVYTATFLKCWAGNQNRIFFSG